MLHYAYYNDLCIGGGNRSIVNNPNLYASFFPGFVIKNVFLS